MALTPWMSWKRWNIKNRKKEKHQSVLIHFLPWTSSSLSLPARAPRPWSRLGGICLVEVPHSLPRRLETFLWFPCVVRFPKSLPSDQVLMFAINSALINDLLNYIFLPFVLFRQVWYNGFCICWCRLKQ